jgi:hypothetical protein
LELSTNEKSIIEYAQRSDETGHVPLDREKWQARSAVELLSNSFFASTVQYILSSEANHLVFHSSRNEESAREPANTYTLDEGMENDAGILARRVVNETAVASIMTFFPLILKLNFFYSPSPSTTLTHKFKPLV